MAPQPQGGGPRITATGDIIWPGPNPSTRQQGLALPLAAGGQQQQQQQGIVGRCLEASRKPLCCFPPASVLRPTWGPRPLFWAPPIFGLSPVLWLLLLLSVAAALAALFTPSAVCVSAFTVLLCLIGLCLHEFAHAATAYHAGVEGVAESGYLTCDLIRYVGILDVLIFVFFVASGGMVLPGGRVNIDERAVRSRGWKTAMALAGPATNLLLGMLGSFCVQVYILIASANPSIIPLPIIGLICFIFLQFMSAFVNLIPFPPLDGWQAISPYFSDTCFVNRFLNNYAWGQRVCLLVSTILLYLLLSRVPAVYSAFIYISVLFTGLPPSLYSRSLHIMLHPLSTQNISLYLSDFFKF